MRQKITQEEFNQLISKVSPKSFNPENPQDLMETYNNLRSILGKGPKPLNAKRANDINFFINALSTNNTLETAKNAATNVHNSITDSPILKLADILNDNGDDLDLSNLDLRILKGRKVDFSGLDLRNCTIEDIDFIHTKDITSCSLEGAKLDNCRNINAESDKVKSEKQAPTINQPSREELRELHLKRFTNQASGQGKGPGGI